MGEYIHKTKLGTCESLYYTTFEQLQNWAGCKPEEKESFLKLDSGYLFRFPFPDESFKVGFHEPFNRGFKIELPKGLPVELAHGKISTRIGPDDHQIGVEFNCPFGTEPQVKTYFWHNEKIFFEIVFQKFTTNQGGIKLVTVVRCPYCGKICQLEESEVKTALEYFSEIPDPEEGFKLTIQILEIALKGYQL